MNRALHQFLFFLQNPLERVLGYTPIKPMMGSQKRALHKTHTLRTLLFLAFFGIYGLGWGQGSETFESAGLPSSYSDGSFVGDNAVTWNYIQSRDDAGYEINGEGIMLRRSSDNSKVYSNNVAGGIGGFTCNLLKAYTGPGNRQVELYINGVSQGTSIAWDNTSVQTFTVNGINVSGNVIIEIRNITSKQVIIDDISWTGYSGSTPTVTTTPTSLTGFTYVEGAGPSAEQSFTVEGSNLTNDITVTPPTNWEISLTSGGTFQNTAITLTQSGGNVASTPIYTRMVSGLLNVNSPFNGDIACASTGATTQNVAVDGTVTVACVAPTTQPTALVLDNETASSIDVSFTAASPAADGYLVVRSETSSLSGNPVDATTYAINDALGGGTVAAVGSSTSFTDTGLTANTTYYYFVFAYNDTACSGGPVYNTTAPLTGNATTLNGPTILYSGGFEDADEAWSYISNGGTSDWERSNDGGTYSPGDNGHDGTYYAWFYGYNEDADDWLVSPTYDFSSHTNIEMDFWTWMRNSGPNIQMKISSDYVSGNPSTATWTDLSPILATSTESWTNSGVVDLSAFDGESNVHIAFFYTGNDVDKNWAVDDYSISGILNNTPEIEITGNGVEIIDGDTTPSVADDTDFGNLEVTGGSTAHTFTINNTGGADLTLTNITSDNATEFAVSGTTSGTITAGNSSTFTVTFDPTALGTRTATITVVSDDTDENPYTFAIQGTGTNSATSDIIANAGFSYTSDIDYLSYQADPITNTSHSIGVFSITLRDGGAAADTDALATELNDLSLSYIVTANTIRAAALFDGNTHLADAVVTANGIAFTGLSGADFTAADNGTLNLTLRVSFTTTVVDNEQLQFTITSATANTAGSVFGTADAGGATSSISGDDNRIEVTADRLAFSVQPTDQTLNTNLAPFTIIATDVNDNQDLDATNNLTLSTSGAGVMTHSSPYTMSAGQAVVSDVQFDTAQTGITITATTTGLTNNSSTSSSFNISDVASGTYRTTAGGTWPSGTATWERFNGSAWVTATPSANTTDLLIIRHTVSSRASFAAPAPNTSMIVESGGYFNDGHNSTFGSLIIMNGGTFMVSDPAVDIRATTGNLTVESGGLLIINSSTFNHNDGLFEGIENFMDGSTVEIQKYDNDSSPGEDDLIENLDPISPNAEGYYFGNLYINFTNETSKAFTLVGITGTQKLCKNDLTIANQTAAEIVQMTNVDANVEIGGNLIVTNNRFSLGTVGSSNITHTIKGDVVVYGSGAILDLNATSSGGATVTINLEGNLQTVSGATLRSSDAGCKIVFNGDGTTQTIDLAGTLGTNADFEVANNAVAQIINQDVDLTNASNDFDVLTGGTLEFNYFDIIGSGKFEQQSGGILKITSADGVNASGASGNVQNTGTRTFSQTGHYHYVGNVTPQTTGTAMTSSSTAKRIVINKDNTTDIVNLTQSTGSTNELNITKGVLVETEAANISGSGDLTMETEGTYKTAVKSATVPQLSGTYSLNGTSTIELNAAGDQTLRGAKDYRNLTFSVSGTKTITSATANIVGEVYITDDAILDVENKTFGGANTDFLMDTNSVYRTAGTGTKPDAQGTYILDGNSKIVFTNTAATLQSIRLTPDYMNIDIEGTSVGNASYLTGISLQSGGTFTVKDGGVFKLKNEAGFTGSTATAISYANNPTVSLEAGSTVEFATDNGNNQTITLFSPHYTNLGISGTGVKTLGDATGIVVNEDLNVDASKLLIQEAESITIQDAIQNQGEIEVLDKGSIVQINEVDNNDTSGAKAGSYIIHRTTRPYAEYDYTYWSSPIEDESFAGAFDNNSSVVVPGGEPSNGDHNSVMSRIFSFDTSSYEDTDNDGFDDDPNDNGCWRSVAPSDLMVKGKGYIAMGAGSDWPFNPDVAQMANGLVQSVYFDGNKIHNGSFTYTLVADANAGDSSINENLVGNPYPSAIDLVALRNHAQNNPGNNPVMGSTVQFWSHDTQITYNPNGLWAYNFTNADYATYNIENTVGTAAHAGSPIPTQYWASCQSIIIEAQNPGDLYFKNSMRVVDQNTNFFKSQETDKDALWLELSNENGLYRQIAVVFMEGADDTVNDYDSMRNLYPDEPDFYSLAPDNEAHLVIQGLSSFEGSKTVDLGIRLMEPGDHTFSIPQLIGVFETTQHIYLKDYKTGVLHDLSKQDYEFSVSDNELGENNDRFELRFIDEASAGTEDMALSSLSVYPNPSNAIFYFTWTGMEAYDIKVYDLNARLVHVSKLQSGEGLDLSDLQAGIYMAKINDGVQEVNRKLILK